MISIKTADRGDAVAISALMTPVAQSQIALEFPQEGQDAFLRGLAAQVVGQRLQEGYRYYLACDGDRLCGVIGMRGYSHLYHLFVAADYQGQGIGRQLWNRARQASLAELPLKKFTVFSSRNAEGFYRRLGFTRTGDEMTRRGVTAIPMHFVIDNTESE